MAFYLIILCACSFTIKGNEDMFIDTVIIVRHNVCPVVFLMKESVWVQYNKMGIKKKIVL